jgi:hypothetical protein
LAIKGRNDAVTYLYRSGKVFKSMAYRVFVFSVGINHDMKKQKKYMIGSASPQVPSVLKGRS